MNLIVLEVYDALIEAGASEAKARAAAGAIPVGEHLATKADIAELGVQIAEHRAATAADIAKLRAATAADIAELRAATAADIAELRAATTADIGELRSELVVLKMGVFTIGPATLALLVKLVFFP